jgi:hypothetical protein
VPSRRAGAQRPEVGLVASGLDGQSRRRGRVPSGRDLLVGDRGTGLDQPAGADRLPAASAQPVRGDERAGERGVAAGEPPDVGQGPGIRPPFVRRTGQVDLAGLRGEQVSARVQLPAIVSSMLLPEPLGPMIATSSPPCTDRSTSCSAQTSLAPTRTRRPDRMCAAGARSGRLSALWVLRGAGALGRAPRGVCGWSGGPGW